MRRQHNEFISALYKFYLAIIKRNTKNLQGI